MYLVKRPIIKLLKTIHNNYTINKIIIIIKIIIIRYS